MRTLAILFALTTTGAEPLLQLGSDRFRHPGLSEYRENRLLFSHDGKHLITYTPSSGAVRTWEPITGKLVREVTLPKNRGVAWSPDGRWLATLETIEATQEIAAEYFLHLRDATSGKIVRSLPVKLHTLSGTYRQPVQFLPGSKEVAVRTESGLGIYEVATGTELIHQRLAFPLGYECVLAPDGKRIVRIDSFAGSLLVWDWEGDAEPRTVQTGLKGRRCDQAVFAPDGKTLALFGDAGPVALVDVATGKLMREFRLPKLRGFDSVAFTPDGKHLLAADNGARNLLNVPVQEGGVVVWDVATGKVAHHWKTPGAVGGLTLSSDGKQVALNAPGLPVWEVTTGRRVNPDTAADRAHTSSVVARAGLLLTLGDQGPACLWNERGRLLHTFPHDHLWVRGGAISPDGKRVATASFDAINVWDATTGTRLWKLPAHGYIGSSPVVAFSADGTHLVSCGSDFYLRVTELTHGKAVREFALRPQGQTRSEDDPRAARLRMHLLLAVPTLSDDGAFVFLAGSVFDTRTGAEVQVIGGTSSINTLPTFSADGRLLFQAERAPTESVKVQGYFRNLPVGKDTLRCYDVATSEPLWAVELDGRFLHRLARAPDGRTLAYAGGSGENRSAIEFRSARDGRLLATLPHQPQDSRHLTYLPDGKRFALTLTDGTVRVYAVPELTESSR